MAKKITVSKATSYRRCTINPKQAQTLQQLVSAALVNLIKVDDRLEPLDSEAKEFRVIGKHKVVDGFLCGYLSTFERGRSQPTITDEPTATALSLGAAPPPNPAKGAKQQQYIPGVVYFAIYGNHVAVIQNTAMRSVTLESHLNWLLKSKTSTLLPTAQFALSDQAQKATVERIKKSHVKKIALGQPLMADFVPAADSVKPAGADQPLKSPKKEHKFKPQGPVVELIKQFFETEGFEKLGLDKVFDGNLEVWIEIRYPKRKRSNPEDAIKLMDNLGLALRDIEGDQVKLQLANGHTVSGHDLKVSGTVEAVMLANGLPDEDKVWEKMTEWLGSQIKNGVVDPD